MQLHACKDDLLMQSSSFKHCFLFIYRQAQLEGKGRAACAISYQQRALKYALQIPAIYPRIMGHILEAKKDAIACAQEIYQAISRAAPAKASPAYSKNN